MSSSSVKRRRRRVGCVSVYLRGGRYWIYYRQAGEAVRRPVGIDADAALRLASKINAELAEGAQPSLMFKSIEVAGLILKWLDHHEQIRRSSLATVRRYRTAIQYLASFVQQRDPKLRADRFNAGMAEELVRHLRGVRAAPNGHPNAAVRPLRDKGVVFILEACRALFGFAAKQRHLPAYAVNPFSALSIERMPIEDAKPVRPMTAQQELAFFQACDDWQFRIFFVLAFTGLRVGELTHLLIDHDLDLDAGLLRVSNKAALGWQVKTRNLRDVPLLPPVVDVLRKVVAHRRAGPVFVGRKVVAGKAVPPLVAHSVLELEQEVQRRIASAQSGQEAMLSRAAAAPIARSAWVDAGAIKETKIRAEFIKVTRKIGLAHLTCPKDLRHLFATSLQAAGVDPMIRRDVMGHTTLQMTSHYTHPQAEIRLRELGRLEEVRGEVLALARSRQSGDLVRSVSL